MKNPDLFPLMDNCVTAGEHLYGLLEALHHSQEKLEENAMHSCIDLCKTLEESQANNQANLFRAIHQLNIVKKAVNGDGA